MDRSILYGLANLAYFLGSSAFNTYALYFYTDRLGAPAALIGQAWLLFGVWNTLNDLLCGWLSDRIAGPRRRALPILVLGLPLGASFAAIWNPPMRDRPGALFWYFLLAAALYDLLQTATNISQSAAFPEIARTRARRARLAAVRQACAALGTIVGVAASPWVYGRFGWGSMGIAWGALLAVLWLLSVPGFEVERTAGDRERARSEATRPAAGWRESLRAVLENAPFRSFLAIHLATRLALAFLQLALPFYAAHVLRLSPDDLSAALGVLLGAAVASVPVWSRLLRRVEPRSVGIGAALYLAALTVPFLFATKLRDLLLLALLIGPAYAGITVVLDLLFAQVVDADRVRSGRSQAGLYSGIVGTVLRIAPALAGWLLGWMLSLAGFDPALSEQPARVRQVLRAAMAGVPACALLAAGAALAAYPLRGRALARLEAAIRESEAAER